MTSYVGFIRAVNVGGTGKLPMADLRKMCRELGFADVQSYIASGNIAFISRKTEKAVKTALEERLGLYAGKPVGVFVRTATQIRSILNKNPFADKDPKHTLAIFLDRKPSRDILAQAVGRVDEETGIGAREIYVYYPSGISRSKLRIPAAKDGTARNMNTIKKMTELASARPAA